MAGVAKIIIVGNLGRDPEMRYTQSGTPVTNFSVAVTRRYNDRDGNRQEETEWFSVDCWNRLAETANQYLSKGSQVYIEGRPKLETWDDRTSGEKRSRIKVTATEMQMLGSRGEQQAQSMAQGQDQRAPMDNYELDNMPF